MIKTKQPKTEQEKIIEDIDTSIHEIPEPPNVELCDPLLNVLSTDVKDILKSNYITDKEIGDKTIEQIKDEYNFDQIKDAFDEGQIPSQLEFFSIVTMIILSMHVTFYHLMKITVNLYLFYALIWGKI